MKTNHLKKQIKQFLLGSTIFASIVTFAPLAHAGDRSGNGGSGDESKIAAQQAELESISSKIRIFFLKNGNKLKFEFPEFEIQDLVDRIKAANIQVVNENELIDRHGVSRTCLNYSSMDLIKCSHKSLETVKDPKALFVLMLHEYLGLLGVEETSPQNAQAIDGYSISKRIAPYVTKVNDYDLQLSPNEPSQSSVKACYVEVISSFHQYMYDYHKTCFEAGISLERFNKLIKNKTAEQLDSMSVIDHESGEIRYVSKYKTFEDFFFKNHRGQNTTDWLAYSIPFCGRVFEVYTYRFIQSGKIDMEKCEGVLRYED